MENNEIPINYNYDNQEVEVEINNSVYRENTIESISVNGVEQEIDENKNVDITVPTKTSDLTNDSNYIEDSNYVHTDNNYTNAEKSKLSDLENYDDTQIKEDIEEIQDDISNLNTDITDLSNNKADKSEIPDVSSFITKTVDDLVNYYKKSETYTQTEVNNLIGAINQFHYEIVQTLPQTGANNILYLVPKSTSETENIYDEYVYANNNWEKIGDTQIDLSNYYTKSQVDTLISNIDLSNYYTKSQVDALIPTVPTNVSAFTNDAGYLTQHQDISGKQDKLTAGNNIDITNNVISATDTTYTAGTGIDITNGVISNTQTSAEWGNITGTLSNQTDLNTALGDKQNTLVSGTNIKTINNESILGSGNIEIQGGAGETLPVGTEVDFSGQASDIPVGWQQVSGNNLVVKTLWTNQNPDSEFIAQSVILNSSDYDYIIVLTYNNISQKRIINNGLFPKGYNCTIDQCATGGTKGYTWTRSRFIDYVSDTELYFQAGKYQRADENGQTTDVNNILVPIKIIGLKEV